MFKQQQPTIESLYTSKPTLVAFLGTLLLLQWLLQRLSVHAWWGDLVQWIAAIGVAAIVLSFHTRHQLRASLMWPIVDAHIEGVELIQSSMYRVSYSFSLNGKAQGADINIPAKEWQLVPTETLLLGRTLRVRVNPKRFCENFILRSSLSELRPSRKEWMKN